MSTPVIYIGIGNSDNKLTQAEWSEFVSRVRTHIYFFARVNRHPDDDGTPPASGGPKVIGDWLSNSDSPYQNACWCLTWPGDVDPANMDAFRKLLARTATRFRQDAISWTVGPETELLAEQDSQ